MSHSSKVWSLMAGEAWLQECEAGGHFASTVRKQRWMLMLSSLSPLQEKSRISVQGVILPSFSVGLQLRYPNQKVPHRRGQGHVSKVVLDPVNVSINNDHHRE